jgi:hypothetical protein
MAWRGGAKTYQIIPAQGLNEWDELRLGIDPNGVLCDEFIARAVFADDEGDSEGAGSMTLANSSPSRGWRRGGYGWRFQFCP